MSDETKAAIRTFIVENFLFGDNSHPLPADLSLIDNDLVDSTGILELVGFLEERFDVQVADADIVPANLDTIERIAGFITRKQAA
ncbi:MULTISPECIES: acyl carrier protein [unclassified Shinella]|uniref:acyl carrier protein n=1 Tax=Shinella TaxID=323620 RepID=UPI00225D54BC|nr:MULTISPECIES: acyl carrier protein [unclassified Shinella]MCO5137881.1 acyl carrier protein [Shinella sp.]MDC7257998.1 acyl carrier protein [Shinella sp. YE25]CAI0335251.1 Acyl carrier protein [Rhizobiaceae bacterium]CAK7259560.1 Acyl carrier protein [Shinella sp. WSC3-e]